MANKPSDKANKLSNENASIYSDNGPAMDILHLLSNNEKSIPAETIKNDQQLEQLQGELADEKDKRKEERFAWLFACVFLVLCIVLQTLPIGACLIITPFSIVFLIVMANCLGVEYAIKPLRWLTKSVNKLIDLKK